MTAPAPPGVRLRHLSPNNSGRVVVNVSAGGNGQYMRGQVRLLKSLDRMAYPGNLLMWDQMPEGCPAHSAAPYAFKVYAFIRAFEAGFNTVLWLDSSVTALKPIEPIFAQIERDGWFLCQDGWNVCQWSTDRALESFGLTRDAAWEIPCLMAGIMGLSAASTTAMNFLNEWRRYADDGVTFPGPWSNKNGECSSDPRCLGHRHDQVAASVVRHRFGMKTVMPHESPEKPSVFAHTHKHPATILFVSGIGR